jgi:hypothetical protein
MGRVYRETTPAMLARIIAALDDRTGLAAWIAASGLSDAGESGELGLDEGTKA